MQQILPFTCARWPLAQLHPFCLRSAACHRALTAADSLCSAGFTASVAADLHLTSSSRKPQPWGEVCKRVVSFIFAVCVHKNERWTVRFWQRSAAFHEKRSEAKVLRRTMRCTDVWIMLHLSQWLYFLVDYTFGLVIDLWLYTPVFISIPFCTFIKLGDSRQSRRQITKCEIST